MQYSYSLQKHYAPTVDDGVELNRPYLARKRRQYKICHKHNPRLKKVWQKSRRVARAKRK